MISGLPLTARLGQGHGRLRLIPVLGIHVDETRSGLFRYRQSRAEFRTDVPSYQPAATVPQPALGGSAPVLRGRVMEEIKSCSLGSAHMWAAHITHGTE